MKTIFLALFFSVTTVHAKFSMSAFQAPCHEIELEVTSCLPKTFSNVEEETQYRKEFQNWKTGDHLSSTHKPLTIQGAIIEGKIIGTKPAKCSYRQDMKVEMYKPFAKKEGRFFALEFTCAKMKRVHLLEIKNFCDTPGSYDLPECFLFLVEVKNKLMMTSIIGK